MFPNLRGWGLAFVGYSYQKIELSLFKAGRWRSVALRWRASWFSGDRTVVYAARWLGIGTLLCACLVAAAKAPSDGAVAAAPGRSGTETLAPVPAPSWETAFAAFAAQDKANPPAPGGTVFVGSSTFTRWHQLPEVFKDFHALNRGFGGSKTDDVLENIDRLVLAYKPAAVVYYCGTNDLAVRGPSDVLANFKAFCAQVHAKLPEAKIYFLSIKQTIKRENQRELVAATNQLVRSYAGGDATWLRYVDINSPMCDAKGMPRQDLLESDLLHPNAKGYAVIAPVIRAALLGDGFGGGK